jgi:phosphoribosylformylglycinamidine synthase
VQGNTVLTPLAGACGDAPQDAAVMRVDGSSKLVAMACALLPEWGKTDPRAMGRAVVDECVRALVATGADPEKIAILDNLCLGNPDDPRELGSLVECVKGLAEAAEAFGTPFISGKDSFYNFFMTDDGPVSIPVTALVSGLGIIDDKSQVIGASLRGSDSELFLLGLLDDVPLGGSVVARMRGLSGQPVPGTDCARHLANYRGYHQAVVDGLVMSCHDVSEGGLAVALAEMAFSMVAGVEVETAAPLFAEPTGCLVVEVAAGSGGRFVELCGGLGLDVRRLGRATAEHRRLVIRRDGGLVIDEPIEELKAVWRGGLARWY